MLSSLLVVDVKFLDFSYEITDVGSPLDDSKAEGAISCEEAADASMMCVVVGDSGESGGVGGLNCCRRMSWFKELKALLNSVFKKDILLFGVVKVSTSDTVLLVWR